VLNSNEFHPYFKDYIQLVEHEPILLLLEKQLDILNKLTEKLTDEQSLFRYNPGKWSVKEVIGHIIDTERIFGSRAVTFARNDSNALPGFEQDDYVREAEFDARPLSNLCDEFYHLRKSNIAFFSALNENQLLRKGKANDVIFSVRSVAYIMGGHFAHHINVLNEKYI